MCSKRKEMFRLLHWPVEQTNPVLPHAVVLQDSSILAPEAISKHPVFFKMVTLCLLYYLLKWKSVY